MAASSASTGVVDDVKHESKNGMPKPRSESNVHALVGEGADDGAVEHSPPRHNG